MKDVTAQAGRRTRRRRGQALVEFALVAPVLFLMILAIIELGRFVFAYEVANNAVREGTRYAIVHGSSSVAPVGPTPAAPDAACPPTTVDVSAVANVVRQNAYTLAPPANLAICWPDSTNLRSQRVSVTGDWVFRVLIPIVPLPPITIHAESTLVINN